MIKSIQTDEARHSEIGSAVLKVVVEHDRGYAAEVGLAKPWYSDKLVASVDIYHHIVHASP